MWYKVKYFFFFFYCALKKSEIPAEGAFCRGKVKGAKPHESKSHRCKATPKLAEIDSGGQKTVQSVT